MLTARSTGKSKPAPGPRYLTPSTLARFRSDPLAEFGDAFRRHGDLVRFAFGPITLHMVMRPDHVEHVLRTNYKNYWKGRRLEAVQAIAGQGLAFTNGDLWRWQRTSTQPGFRPRLLEAMVPAMTRSAEEIAERWRARIAAERSRSLRITVKPEMSRVTLAVLGRALFSTDLDARELDEAVGPFLNQAYRAMSRAFILPDAIPTPNNIRYRRARRVIYGIVDRVLAARAAMTNPPQDLLSSLIEARRESPEGTEGMLRDELLGLVLAGHQTNAVTLTWTWALLAKHPEKLRRLQAELDQVLSGRTPTLGDLPKLEYTRWVLQESLRMFPPLWVLPREPLQDDEIGGHRIPARSSIYIPTYFTHRHRDFWDAPEDFEPERFSPQRARDRHAYAYCPFGAGPRVCVGDRFSLMQGQILLGTLAQRFELRMSPDQQVVPHVNFFLEPRDPISMTVHPRD